MSPCVFRQSSLFERDLQSPCLHSTEEVKTQPERATRHFSPPKRINFPLFVHRRILRQSFFAISSRYLPDYFMISAQCHQLNPQLIAILSINEMEFLSNFCCFYMIRTNEPSPLNKKMYRLQTTLREIGHFLLGSFHSKSESLCCHDDRLPQMRNQRVSRRLSSQHT